MGETMLRSAGLSASMALHQHFGFGVVGTFSENGRRFGRFWDVMWIERSLKIAA